MITNLWEIHNALTVTMKKHSKYGVFLKLNEIKNIIYKSEVLITSKDQKRMQRASIQDLPQLDIEYFQK